MMRAQAVCLRPFLMIREVIEQLRTMGLTVMQEKDMDEELVKACEEDEEEEDTGNAIPTNHYTERFQRVT